MAAETAADASQQLRGLLGEILMEEYKPTKSGQLPAEFLPLRAVTDCKSLFDLLTKEGTPSSTQEKRIAIDIAAMREIADELEHEDPKKTFMWVPTDHQRADHLAKLKPPHQLRDILDSNWLSLTSTLTMK